MLILETTLLGIIYTFSAYGVYKLIDNKPKIIIIKSLEEEKQEKKKI